MKIEIKNLSKVYPNGKRALSDINLELNSPCLVGLLGPNGAGKTTLMELLTFNQMQSEGSITMDGVDFKKCEKKLKSKLGYLPQEFGLYDELSVYQFLDYVAGLKGMGSETRKSIEQVISYCNLYEKRKAKIRTLSGGQKQRVGIAQALLGNPQMLILDEPTVGLDPEERIKFRNLFSESARDRIVLLSTHIIEDIQSVCNRLIVINMGKIVFDGTPEGLIELAKESVDKPTLEDAYMFLMGKNSEGCNLEGCGKEMKQ